MKSVEGRFTCRNACSTAEAKSPCQPAGDGILVFRPWWPPPDRSPLPLHRETAISRPDEPRRTEERFHLAALAAQDLIWDWDLVGGGVAWAGTTAPYFGLLPEGRQRPGRGSLPDVGRPGASGGPPRHRGRVAGRHPRRRGLLGARVPLPAGRRVVCRHPGAGLHLPRSGGWRGPRRRCHARRQREEGGRAGHHQAGGHRGLLQRRHRRQEPRRGGDQLERGGGADLRLQRAGDGGSLHLRPHSGGAARLGARAAGANPAGRTGRVRRRGADPERRDPDHHRADGLTDLGFQRTGGRRLVHQARHHHPQARRRRDGPARGTLPGAGAGHQLHRLDRWSGGAVRRTPGIPGSITPVRAGAINRASDGWMRCTATTAIRSGRHGMAPARPGGSTRCAAGSGRRPRRSIVT